MKGHLFTHPSHKHWGVRTHKGVGGREKRTELLRTQNLPIIIGKPALVREYLDVRKYSIYCNSALFPELFQASHFWKAQKEVMKAVTGTVEEFDFCEF